MSALCFALLPRPGHLGFLPDWWHWWYSRMHAGFRRRTIEYHNTALNDLDYNHRRMVANAEMARKRARAQVDGIDPDDSRYPEFKRALDP